jgi:hypothetical protein
MKPESHPLKFKGGLFKSMALLVWGESKIQVEANKE